MTHHQMMKINAADYTVMLENDKHQMSSQGMFLYPDGRGAPFGLVLPSAAREGGAAGGELEVGREALPARLLARHLAVAHGAAGGGRELLLAIIRKGELRARAAEHVAAPRERRGARRGLPR